MVEMGVLLGDRNHQGKIYAVSRRCLFALTHQSTTLYPAFLTPDTPLKGFWACYRGFGGRYRWQRCKPETGDR